VHSPPGPFPVTPQLGYGAQDAGRGRAGQFQLAAGLQADGAASGGLAHDAQHRADPVPGDGISHRVKVDEMRFDLQPDHAECRFSERCLMRSGVGAVNAERLGPVEGVIGHGMQDGHRDPLQVRAGGLTLSAAGRCGGDQAAAVLIMAPGCGRGATRAVYSARCPVLSCRV